MQYAFEALLTMQANVNLTTEVALVRVLLPGPAAGSPADQKVSDLHSVAVQLMQVKLYGFLKLALCKPPIGI